MKKRILLSLILISYCIGNCQIVSIPDLNFLKALIDEGVDINNDQKIQVSEASVVDELSIGYKSISNLEGIQAFTNLSLLFFNNNDLDSVDLSQNKKIKYLSCSYNYLSFLNVSENIALISFECQFNQLQYLDISKNLVLNSGNTAVVCNNNNLTEICINQSQVRPSIHWLKDITAKWTTNCNVITGLETEATPTSHKTLVHVYNLFGQEVDPNDSGQGVFIYCFTDGSRVKTLKSE